MAKDDEGPGVLSTLYQGAKALVTGPGKVAEAMANATPPPATPNQAQQDAAEARQRGLGPLQAAIQRGMPVNQTPSGNVTPIPGTKLGENQ